MLSLTTSVVVYTAQIRPEEGFCSTNKLKNKINLYADAPSVHSSPAVENQNYEQKLNDWTINKQNSEIEVSTAETIAKAISLCPPSKDLNHKECNHWIYPFLKYGSCQAACNADQKLSVHLITAQKPLIQNLIKIYKLSIITIM